MDIKALDQALALSDGRLVLTGSLLPGAPLGDLLMAYNGGQPITIDGARKETGQTAITVTGTASFMTVANLPVTAVFALDGAGNPTASLRFTLIDGLPVANAWQFSRSFPHLPSFPSPGLRPTRGAPNLLDQLLLSDAAYILNTAAGQDEATGAPLAYGLNFVSKLTPTGLVGLFETLLGGDKLLTLYGTITPPAPATSTPALPLMTYPWRPQQWPVPGIHLQADLGIELKVDKLTFDQTSLHIYTPLTTDWLNANPSYGPDMAVAGKLSIPSADLAVDVAAVLNPNQITLVGQFDGFSLEHLAQLADIAPGGDLVSHLPAALQDPVKALAGISLTAAGIGFSGSLSANSVEFAYVTVGLPELKWEVFSGFTLEQISAQFMVATPFSAPAISATLQTGLTIGGAPFNVFTQVPDFNVRADLLQTASLPLNALFKQNLPELPAPPDLSVSAMQLNVTPGKSYSFTAIMAEDPPWRLDLGPVGLTISGVSLDLAKQTGASATGSFGGSLTLNDTLRVDARYELPGSFFVRAQLPDLKLSELIAMLDEDDIKLPTGFDIALQQPYLLLSEQSGTLTFTAATTVADLGLLALTAQKPKAGRTGVAVGIQLLTDSLTQIAGLEALSAFQEFVGLQKLMFVVSSLDQPGFTFPDMANFQAPSLAGQSLQLPPQASGLVKGLNFYAQLATSKSKGFQTLAQYLGIKLDGTVGITLSVSLPDPVTNSKLFLSVSQEIDKGTFLTGQLGGLLTGGEVGAFLLATVRTKVQGQPAEFAVSATVLENGVMIAGAMKGTVKFDPLPVQLSNLGLVVGISWELIPSLGIAATIDVQDFNSSVAIFFDSVDPTKSMFAGAVSDVTLAGIANTIAGQSNVPGELQDVMKQIGLKGLKAFTMPASVGTALDGRDLTAIAGAFAQYGAISIPSTSQSILLEINSRGSVWHLTDMSTMLHYSLTRKGDQIQVDLQPQIYCAPKDTYIGPPNGGIRFPQAFYVDAEIDFLMLQAQIRVLINPRIGIAADVDIEPISIFNPTFFAVTAAKGQGGPRLSLATFKQPKMEEGLQDPHFLVNGRMQLLGVEMASAYISITTRGLEFRIAEQVNPWLRLDVQGNFDSLNNLGVGGKAVVGFDRSLDLGKLGKVQVKTDVNGAIDIGYKKGTAYATFQGGFDFQGIHGTIPTLKLDVTGPALAKIADTLWEQIKDIINKALTNADQWLKWVQSGVIQGAGQTAQAVGYVLDQVYHLPDSDIAKKTKQYLGYGADKIAQALSGAGATAEQAVQTLAGLGYKTEEITKAIGAAFKGIHADTSFGHVDTKGPHVDVPKVHTDIKKKHVDTGKSWYHIDKKTPHTDIGTPHGDTTPHVDTGTHIDIKA